MRKLLVILMILAVTDTALAADVGICEVVMIEKFPTDEKKGQAFLQKFAPAGDFLTSVYADDDGHIASMDGQDIQAVLCERPNVIPTLRDFPILATGIPLAISDNFDAVDSQSVTLYFKKDKFHHVVKGRAMTEAEQAQLDNTMEVFNLQPHKLDKK